MELWIRSQNRESLVKVNDISIEMNMIYGYFDKNTEYELLGQYKTKERALEVLDIISNKIKNQYIVKTHNLIKPSEATVAIQELEEAYDGDFILQQPSYEIVPINQNTIYFEMPKE